MTKFESIQQVKQAAAAGQTVAWRNDTYIVREGALGFEVRSELNGSSDPLNPADYDAADFYVVA